MGYTPTVPTIVFMSVFLIGYLAVLIRNTVRNRIDLFDFAMLASVAVVPAVVVFLPGVVVGAARLIGVEFPFLVLFGALFVIVFAYLYTLVLRLNALRRATTALVQEVGLLREALQHERAARD